MKYIRILRLVLPILLGFTEYCPAQNNVRLPGFERFLEYQFERNWVQGVHYWERLDLGGNSQLTLGLRVQEPYHFKVRDRTVNDRSGFEMRLEVDLPLETYSTRWYYVGSPWIRPSTEIESRIRVIGGTAIVFREGDFCVNTDAKLEFLELRISDTDMPGFLVDLINMDGIQQKITSKIRQRLREFDTNLERMLNRKQDILAYRNPLPSETGPIMDEMSIVGAWKGRAHFHPRHGETGVEEYDSFIADFVVRFLPDNRLKGETDSWLLYGLAKYVLSRYEVEIVNYTFFPGREDSYITVKTNSLSLDTLIPGIRVVNLGEPEPVEMGGKLSNGSLIWIPVRRVR